MMQKNGLINIHYETHGETGDKARQWIVFSHSLACNSSMWEKQIPEFASVYRVLAFDTRGHGRSSAPKPGQNGENYSFEELVSDVDCLLKALEIENAHFVGLSMGGMLGQAYALAHPDRLCSLTIADSVCEWPQGTSELFAGRVSQAREGGMQGILDGSLGRWFTAEFRRSNPAEVAKVAEMIKNTPVDGYAGCSYSIPRINYTSRLRNIAAPILAIAGRQDPATTVEMAEQIHQAAPGSSLSIIENAAHLSNVEQPKAFNTAIMSFLRERFARV